MLIATKKLLPIQTALDRPMELFHDEGSSDRPMAITEFLTFQII